MTTLATPEGTRRYTEKLQAGCAAGHFRSWPPGLSEERSLHLASVGLGSYTGPATDEGDRQYEESVRQALRSGINVIDCAINYRHMRSERALGRGVNALIAAGEIQRDEVFLMSKGGYFPFDGAVPEDPGGFLRETYLDTGLCRPEEIVAGNHCIAPLYLEDQLRRSLGNFGVEALDVYFLHNLEQQLEEVSTEEFHKRVAAAFAYLETEVARGRIGSYGAATWNGFRVPPDRQDHLSLESLMSVAREAGGEGHHFHVIQLPYNLGMPEALTQATQSLEGKQVPILEAAAAFGLIVVTSVPLLQTQILPHVPPAFSEAMPGLDTPAQRAIQFVRSTPGVLAPLVGMREVEHVRENARLVGVAPLDAKRFFRLIGG